MKKGKPQKHFQGVGKPQKREILEMGYPKNTTVQMREKRRRGRLWPTGRRKKKKKIRTEMRRFTLGPSRK